MKQGFIRTNSDAIQATIAERSAVAEHHAAHRDDIAVLAHTDDRVVTAVRHIKVGPSFQRALRWYLTFKLSSGDLVQIMAERGIALAHTTILRSI